MREFMGNIETILRAYSWIMGMGPDGLRTVAETSIININYLIKKLTKIRGVTLAYPKQNIRLDQARFSLKELKDETSVGTDDVARRIVDFGVQEYFTSHHPWIVQEPFLPEPCETYSKEDIDYWAEIIRYICEEARTNPETVKTAPHNQTIKKINTKALNDPNQWALTWRAYIKKKGKK
jgi:glycine dehydrogenase subunit 2